MKRLVQVFPRDTYVGEEVFSHELALCDLLGQGDQLLIEIFGQRIGTDARARITCFGTSLPSGRPRQVGKLVQVIDPATGLPANSVAFVVLRPPVIRVDPTFAGRLEIVLSIESVNPGATPNPEFDLEVHCTVILQS